MPKHYSQDDFNSIPLLGVRIEVNATAPSTPQAGRLWYDTNVNALKVWNGTAWIRADGFDIPDGTITNAKVAVGAAIALSKLATDPLTRANHTGTQLAATISDLATIVKAYRLDEFALPNAALNLNGQRVTNSGVPSAATDLATKQYVDDARAGISVKDPVKVVATTNIVLTAPGANVDGVAMAVDDRFLATTQTTTTQNGVYLWKGAAVAAVRSLDTDTTGEVLDGSLVAVGQGTQAGSQYIQTATPAGAPGAWTQTWTKYTVGSGGGVLKFAGSNPTLVAGTFASVTHGLNTTDVIATVRDNTTGETVNIDWKVLDANNIQLRADVAVTAGTLRVVVVG